MTDVEKTIVLLQHGNNYCRKKIYRTDSENEISPIGDVITFFLTNALKITSRKTLNYTCKNGDFLAEYFCHLLIDEFVVKVWLSCLGRTLLK